MLALKILLWSMQSLAFTLTAPNLQGYDKNVIVYDYNNTDCPTDIRPSLERAMELWNSVETTRIEIALGTSVSVTPAQAKATAYANAVVVCDPAYPGASGLVAEGGPWVQGSKIVSGYIVINANNSTSSYFGNFSPEIQAIAVAHEMGHSLGLGHSKDKAALMYYDASLKEKLNLSQDDVDGITYLYPRDEFNGDLMGCGTVGKVGRSGHKYLYLVFLFLLPLVLALGLKTRVQSLVP